MSSRFGPDSSPVSSLVLLAEQDGTIRKAQGHGVDHQRPAHLPSDGQHTEALAAFVTGQPGIDLAALGISSTFPEDSNYGLVNERDEPRPGLTATAAELNPRACELHLAGKLEAAEAWTRQAPGNQWTRPDASAVTAVRQDADFTMVDIAVSRRADG